MAFFDKLSNTLSAAGKDGINKARELKDTAKLAVDIKEREGSIHRLYRELGKAYYQAHKDDVAPDFEQILAIKAAFEEIGELKATMDDIRGIKRCPQCGGVVAIDAKFCSKCGAKCEEEVECEVVEEEVCEAAEECCCEEAAEEACCCEEAAEEACCCEEAAEKVEEACCCSEE